MQKSIFWVGLWLLPTMGMAQGVHPYVHPIEQERDSVETKSLQQFFRKGTLFGHGRTFFMATDNAAGFQDYHALAAGMGIAYESGSLFGFQMGLSGFFNYNLLSNDIYLPDPASGVANRYEVGLFDVERPHEREDMDRLEDLYIKYSRNQFEVVFGKQHIRSPFINPQDGRQRPTLVEGLQVQWQAHPKIHLHGAYLYALSPRSTVRWFGIGHSIGVFPAGVNTTGEASNYAGKIPTEFVAFVGAHYKPMAGLELQAWNMYVDQLMNNLLLQADYRLPVGSGALRLGAQFIAQNGVVEAGATHDYLLPGHRARVYGARLGADLPRKFQMTLNYSHIADADRYLMPREWGRDPMFTFLPRERNEGYANVDAINLVIKKQLNERLVISSGTGAYRLPAPDDVARNKYAMPAYYQVNLDAFYTFGGWFEGFTGQLLYVYKQPMSTGPLSDRWVVNKVNMSLWNVVLNYHF